MSLETNNTDLLWTHNGSINMVSSFQQVLYIIIVKFHCIILMYDTPWVQLILARKSMASASLLNDFLEAREENVGAEVEKKSLLGIRQSVSLITVAWKNYRQQSHGGCQLVRTSSELWTFL